MEHVENVQATLPEVDLDALKPKIHTVTGRDGWRSVNYGGDIGTFIIKPFRGMAGAKHTASLIKYAAGTFGGVLLELSALIDESGDKEVDKMDTLGIVLSGALQGAFDKLDDPDFLKFFFDLFSCVTKNGQVLDFDEEFVGDYGLAFNLVQHIITFNFAKVFSRLGIAALLKTKPTQE